MILIPVAVTGFISAVAAHAGSEKLTTLVAPPWKHTLGLNRVGQTHLDLYSGYRKKFSSPQGVATVKLRFNDAEGSGDDDELTVYGVNSGTGEIFYNKSMVSLGFFGREAKSQAVFVDPVGIAADEVGNVVVADRGGDQLVRLRMSEQNHLGFVAAFDLADSGRPARSPSGVAIEGENVYIADSGNNRIVVTDREGHFVKEIGDGANLVDPFGIAVISSTRWNYFNSSFIVVSDSLHQRLTMFSVGGEPMRTIRYSEISDMAGGFDFVAIDYYSNIYVTDTLGGCLFKFDRRLSYLTRIGCGTDTRADLVQPRGIAIYRRFGQIFVAEKSGASYFWTGTDVRNLRCRFTGDGSSLGVDIRFLLTERSTVDIALESADGREVTSLIVDRLMDPGPIALVWPIADSDLPCPLANCKYQLRIQARPTYSAREYLRVERVAPIRPH